MSYAEDIAGMFSSFHISEKSGDFTGVEIHIVKGGRGYAVIVQASEGSPGMPEVFVPQVSGNAIKFEIPPDSRTGLEPAIYAAEIRDDSLTLTGPRGPREVPRRASFWR